MQRNGKVGSGFGLMDNLSYSYQGNRLTNVSDGIAGDNTIDFVPRGSGSYTFWPDGSLKSDANEQISNIVYDNYLKQPTEIQLVDGRKINHFYDGTGALLKTVYSNGEYWQYSNGTIYKNGQPYQMATPEGRAIYTNNAWQYEFFHTDHLGNTRVSFKANGSQLEKTAETAFDPWGVVLNGVGLVNSYQNRNEYQGKEKEATFGLNRINLGARTVNPTTGIMDKIDRFADKYYSFSSYSYSNNNPMKYIDIRGDSLEIVVGLPYTDSRGEEHKYGHMALRVFNSQEGYNMVYDFGRYRKTWGFFDSKGDGILNLYSEGEKYIQSEKKIRNSVGFTMKTSPEEDRTVMNSYANMAVKGIYRGSVPNGGGGAFKLPDDYDVLSNNCCTKTESGLNQIGKNVLGKEYDPRDALKFLEKNFKKLGLKRTDYKIGDINVTSYEDAKPKKKEK